MGCGATVWGHCTGFRSGNCKGRVDLVGGDTASEKEQAGVDGPQVRQLTNFRASQWKNLKVEAKNCCKTSYEHEFLQYLPQGMALIGCIFLGDNGIPSNFVGFRGLATLLPHFCQLSVPEVGVCGVYPESP